MSYHHNIGNGRLRVQGLGFGNAVKPLAPKRVVLAQGGEVQM